MTNIDELKSTGLKATLPRLKILEIFQKGGQRHMTAEDVFRVLLEERSDIGLATVYRVLTQFEQAGILVRHHFEAGKAVYELDQGEHHDHMVCVRCGCVTEFVSPDIETLQERVVALLTARDLYRSDLAPGRIIVRFAAQGVRNQLMPVTNAERRYTLRDAFSQPSRRAFAPYVPIGDHGR